MPGAFLVVGEERLLAVKAGGVTWDAGGEGSLAALRCT